MALPAGLVVSHAGGRQGVGDQARERRRSAEDARAAAREVWDEDLTQGEDGTTERAENEVAVSAVAVGGRRGTGDGNGGLTTKSAENIEHSISK